MVEDGSIAQFLVIGSGLAGLSFALKAADLGEVTILTKNELSDSNSDYAQGGVASVLSPSDDFSSHIEDTLRLGRGLCNRTAVELMIKRGPEEIQWLIDMGVEFDRTDSTLDLGKEGGHSTRRVAHAGDQTGHAIQTALISWVKENPSITVKEHTLAYDLLLDQGACTGVRALDEGACNLNYYQAPVTVLATGGVGHLFAKTSNPEVATGDGVSMAWWAGAEIEDMEFIQFHPTILNTGDSPFFLISETVRGEGGILRNSKGEAFMDGRHPLKDLAPRDTVSREMVEEQKAGPVYLDIRHHDESFLMKRFPAIFKECMDNGYNMAYDLIPVSPAAHYQCGGVKVNLYGETSIPRLYAFGECSCTGVHGANRMASNSLLECMAFTSNAFKKIKLHRIPEYTEFTRPIQVSLTSESDKVKSRLQDLMWSSAGINRSLMRLENALTELNVIHEQIENLTVHGTSSQIVELHNLVTVARLVIRAALTRRESRGTHHLTDHPETDDVNWRRHIVFRRNKISVR